MRHTFPTRQNVLKEVEAYLESRHLAPLGMTTAAETLDAVRAEEIPVLLAAVVGVNDPPTRMTKAEITELGDPFTREILLRGSYPLTLSALVEAIETMSGGIAFPIRKMFLVAEGGQFRLSNPRFELNARLVFTWQKGDSTPPDLLLSTVAVANSEASLLQLIAWSDVDQAFHFFERQHGVWGWAGNSFHALRQPSRGQGPFDSHINGGLVMKELKFPWAHWHSQSSSIPREAFPPDSEFHSNPLFARVDNAEVLENIVKSGVARWTKSRLSAESSRGALKNAWAYFRQIVTPTSANLISTSLEFRRVRGNTLKLPSSFFFDTDGLELGVSRIDPFSDAIPGGRIEVDGDLYADAVRDLEMMVPSDGGTTSVEGDTHFCFLVPERAFEDVEVAKQLLENGIISPRFLLSLLMVDFQNPVRSDRRARLVKYCPVNLNEGESLETLFVSSVEQANASEDSEEAEFLSYWHEANLLERIQADLARFFFGIQDFVSSASGVTLLVKLAEFRKSFFRKRLLNEFRSTTSQLGKALGGEMTISKNGIINEA